MAKTKQAAATSFSDGVVPCLRIDSNPNKGTVIYGSRKTGLERPLMIGCAAIGSASDREICI
jgi:hypothetical protein